jgi:hypothetical protein
VNALKSQPGITKIVLVGASGGGPLMTTYQDYRTLLNPTPQ